MIKISILASILLLVSSCVRPPQLPDRQETTVIVERVKDTTIYVSDSASIQALIECDSLGRAFIREIEQITSGKIIKHPVITIDQKPGKQGDIVLPPRSVLIAKCIIDSAAVYLSWKERDTTTTRVIRPPPEIIRRPWNTWQKIQLWTGRICILLIVGYVAYKFQIHTKLLKIILKLI